MKTWLSGLITKNRRQLEMDLNVLEPRERWSVIEKLLQYSVPKMQSVEAKIDLSQLTDEQLDIVINELTDNLRDE